MKARTNRLRNSQVMATLPRAFCGPLQRAERRGRVLVSTGLFLCVSLTGGAGAASWKLQEQREILGDLVREPMVVRRGTTLFLSGYGAQSAQTSKPTDRPRLWRSEDRGRSWTLADVLNLVEGTEPESLDAARGNSDVDLHVAADGTLYFAVMGFDRTTFRGTHISVGVSGDGGETWRWNRVSETELDDRPWLRTTPDGTAHLIWNDGKGVRLAVSADRGSTWKESDRPRGEGGSSHFAIGPKGEMAVRVSPISGSGNVQHEVDLILLRRRAGVGPWREIELPGERRWAQNAAQIAVVPRWVEPLAFTADGGLFHAWAEGGVLQLARRDFTGWRTAEVGSVFDGEAPRSAGGQSDDAANQSSGDFYPLLTASPEGRLAMTWFHRGAAGDLVARIAVARWPVEADRPVVEVVDEVPVAQTGGEYFPAVWLDDAAQSLGVALTIQEPERQGFAWRSYQGAVGQN